MPQNYLHKKEEQHESQAVEKREMNEQETPQEFAARMAEVLKKEGEDERPVDEALAFVLFIAEPGNLEGRITYASNVPRKPALDFLKEFIERNKPARKRSP